MDNIWTAQLDNRYDCKVTRKDQSTGVLTVIDTNTGNELINEEVVLSYDALFGPDIMDINSWEGRILEVIDAI